MSRGENEKKKFFRGFSVGFPDSLFGERWSVLCFPGIFFCGVQSFSPVKRRVDGTRPWMRPVFPLPAPYRRKRNLFYGKWSVFRLMVDVFVPEIFSSPSEELFSLSGHKRKLRDHERFCRIDLEADGDGFPQDPFPVCRKADRRYIFDSPSFISYKQ